MRADGELPCRRLHLSKPWTCQIKQRMRRHGQATDQKTARGLHQVQTSTAEAPGLECNMKRTCRGVDLRLLFLPLSRNRSGLWENETINHRARSQDRRGAMSVSEAFRGVVDESVGSTEVVPAADGFHLEPRCRICCNDPVRTKVNDLLAGPARHGLARPRGRRRHARTTRSGDH
jgi:hypothetical protein